MNKMNTYTLDNGFTVYLYPNSRRHTTFVQFSTFCGGITKHFSLDGKEYNFVDGVSHVLEHYIVECNNCGNFLEELGNLQMSANASTSITTTSYYFETVCHVSLGIQILLEGIYGVYFDKEKLDNLKNPIYQEIRGKLDNKFYHLNRKKMENLFINIDHRDIGGLLEEVQSITIDDLKLLYEAFYQPSNQFMIIAGNFDKDEIMNTITCFFKNHFIPKRKVEVLDYKEELSVKKKEDIIIFPTPMDYFEFTFKIDISSYTKKQLLDYDFYIHSYLNQTFGIQSSLYQDLVKKQIILDPIHFSCDIFDHFFLITIGDYTTNSTLFKNEVLNEIQSRKSMNRKLFQLDIQNSKIRFILRDESIVKMIRPFVTNLIDFHYPYLDTMDDIIRLNYSDYVKVISSLDFSHYICILIRNK